MNNKSLLEQARKHAKGGGTERTDWNEVLVGERSYNMEYPASETAGRMNIGEIETTPAYIRKHNKLKCGLCTMWYEKKSVSYTVPNHRIIDLRRSWNYLQEGRRYESASYKYTNTPICLLCSQFFSESTESSCTSKPAEASTKKPLYVTNIARTDIAEGKKTYQSNEVDGQGSNLAVMPPYVLGSKTRREADPWWEVDLGMSYHLNSVSITIKGAVQQPLEVNLMLFDGPVGFENPFLDSMEEESVAMHTVVLPANPRPKMEVIDWIMPSNLVGGAFRVQLRGFHTLHLFRVQAFQGDSIHADNLQNSMTKDGGDSMDFLKSQLSLEIGEEGFENLMAAEDKRRFNSYASYHPDTFKNTKVYKERMNRSFAHSKTVSQGDDDEEGRGEGWMGEKSRKGKKKTKQERVNASVAELTSKYRGRDEHVKDWIDRAKEASRYFTTEELVVARDMIFNAAMANAADDEKKRKAEEINNSKSAILKRAASLQVGPQHSNMQVRAQDMYGSALMELYPRIPLEAVTKALRGCASQVQGRDQKGEIGMMQKSPRFLFLGLADTYVIDRFEAVAKAWKESVLSISRNSTAMLPPGSASRTNTQPNTHDLNMTSMQSNSGDVQFQLEISWSQFVIVLYCLSIGKPDDIPPLTFNRFDLKVAEDDDDAKKKKKRSQQKQQQELDALTQQTNEVDDDFFLTTGELNNSPTTIKGNTGNGGKSTALGGGGGTEDAQDGLKLCTRPMTPAFAGPSKNRSKLAKALIAPTDSPTLSPTTSMFRPITVSTAPGGLEGMNTRSIDSLLGVTSFRERNKKEPMTLKEKTKDELIERLNLNFGHAQYKLGRIENRVDVDIAPRRLRTKLTEVSLGELPGGLESLKLGLSYPEQLFEIGAGLSAKGKAPVHDRQYYVNGKTKTNSDSAQQEQTAVDAGEAIARGGSIDSRGFSRSLDTDEFSGDDSQGGDDISEVSLNQILRLQRTATEKPKALMTQDSFVLKTNLKPRRKSRQTPMSPIVTEKPRISPLVKQTSQGSFNTKPSTSSNASPLSVKLAPSFKTQNSFNFDDDCKDGMSTKKSVTKHQSVKNNFKKSCALCLIQFPVQTMPKALLKHVVDLRRLWNPKLVTKFEGRLAEGMSLYNLVPVCTMCSQYFDPDFESGISPPNQCKASEVNAEATAVANDKSGSSGGGKFILKPRKEPIAFYDRRHAGIKEAGDILRDEDTVIVRSRAKRANEISIECHKETSYQSKP